MSAPNLQYPPPTTGGTPVGGSGTVGTIPVWGTTTTTLTDSPLTVSGTTVTATQAFTVNGTQTFNGNLVSGFNQTWTLNGGFLNIQSGLLYLDKTNSRIGIGTTSPAAKFHVKDATNRNIIMTSGTTGMKITSITDASAEADIGVQGNTVQFLTGGTERARIDSSGNVGIGTTPASWNAAVRAIEMRTSALWNFNSGSDSVAYWTVNAFTDTGGNVVYKASAAASQYTQIGGAHVWSRAVSGTAGAPCTFLESMRIDSSGQVGIGTGSPLGALDVRGSGSPAIISANSTTRYGFMQWVDASSLFRVATDGAFPIAFFTNANERARITSTGNVQAASGTTTMTDGFFYIPAAAGAPTGVPTAIAGRVPMYYDTTNDQFYIRNGANWRKVTLT
jgi:hypothetical protein